MIRIEIKLKCFIQIIHWQYKYIYIDIHWRWYTQNTTCISILLAFPQQKLTPQFFCNPGAPKKNQTSPFRNFFRTSNRGKGVKGCNDLLHRKKIFLYMAAVGTTCFVTPCNHGSIHPHSCESGICTNDLFGRRIFVSRFLGEENVGENMGNCWGGKNGITREYIPKKKRSPYCTSPPSYRYTPACWTLCKCSLTLLLSPPDSISPQVTTVLSFRRAAKACMEEAICWTAWSLSRMELLSPPLT